MQFVNYCVNRLALAMMIVFALTGCSQNAARSPVFKVKGKITMGGAPIAGASVFFSPKAKQPVAMGRTNDQGEYTLTTYSSGDGAAEGDYVVLVSKEETTAAPAIQHGAGVDPKSSPSAHDAKKFKGGASGSSSLLPEKYGIATQSPLKATVNSPGPNQIDQELKP